MGVSIDLKPVVSNPGLNNLQMYAYPFTAITVRATALLRFVEQPCLLAPEPSSIVGIVNAIALNPEEAMAPVQLCRQCSTSRFLPAKFDYCLSPILNSVL